MSNSNGPVPLQQQVNDITNIPVATARANMHQVFKATENELAKLPIQIHGAVLQMLNAAFQVRQDTMKDAISEHAARQQWEQQQADKKAQQQLEAQQCEIEEANRPKLVPVG